MSETVHTAPKPFIFVLMPFSKEFDDVYKLAIKAACANAGAYCERVDEQHYDEGMLERIYVQIAKADFIIADMSGKNPNVFYEVGYAHALDKRVILITNDSADIPFDLKHRPHIIYKSVSGLLEELEKRVRWAVENPKGFREFSERRAMVYLEGVELVNEPVVGIRGNRNFSLELSIHNLVDKRAATLNFQLMLEAPSDFGFFRIRPSENSQNVYNRMIVKVGNEKVRCIVKEPFELLPDSWLPTYWHIAANAERKLGAEFDLAVQLLTPNGTLKFPFKVKCLLGE